MKSSLLSGAGRSPVSPTAPRDVTKAQRIAAKPDRVVACNGCTSCCRDDTIILHPECGDDVTQYHTRIVPHPVSAKAVFALQQRADGACIYLGDAGCTIHGRAPHICRTFDCARLVEHLGAAAIKRGLRAGFLSETTIRAGRNQLKNRKGNAA